MVDGNVILGLQQRIDRLEANVKRLCEHLGVEYDDGTGGIPPEVVELARSGQGMQAVKRLVDAHGYDLMDAQRVVKSL